MRFHQAMLAGIAATSLSTAVAPLAQGDSMTNDSAEPATAVVPARPEIYAPIDRDFGHFRRYTRPELRRKLVAAGFEVRRLNYFNFVGYFAWWLNFCLLKKRQFEQAKVRFFDRMIFPAVHTLESSIIRPPVGQSLIAVAVQTGRSQ